MTATAEIPHVIRQNGIGIARTTTGIAVQYCTHCDDDPPVVIEVYHEGRLIKWEYLAANCAWRDYFKGVDMLRCVIRVRLGSLTLAELGHPDAPMPFMVLQGEQQHITESYVSVPPALTITDEGGNVWTLGFRRADADESPRGEFAFEVLRNGIGTGVIASRIERRSGTVRAFTKQGWQVWNGRFFF